MLRRRRIRRGRRRSFDAMVHERADGADAAVAPGFPRRHSCPQVATVYMCTRLVVNTSQARPPAAAFLRCDQPHMISPAQHTSGGEASAAACILLKLTDALCSACLPSRRCTCLFSSSSRSTCPWIQSPRRGVRPARSPLLAPHAARPGGQASCRPAAEPGRPCAPQVPLLMCVSSLAATVAVNRLTSTFGVTAVAVVSVGISAGARRVRARFF